MYLNGAEIGMVNIVVLKLSVMKALRMESIALIVAGVGLIMPFIVALLIVMITVLISILAVLASALPSPPSNPPRHACRGVSAAAASVEDANFPCSRVCNRSTVGFGWEIHRLIPT